MIENICTSVIAVEVPTKDEYGVVGIGFDKVTWYLSKGIDDKFIALGEYGDCKYVCLASDDYEDVYDRLRPGEWNAIALLKLNKTKDYAIIRTDNNMDIRQNGSYWVKVNRCFSNTPPANEVNWFVMKWDEGYWSFGFIDFEDSAENMGLSIIEINETRLLSPDESKETFKMINKNSSPEEIELFMKKYPNVYDAIYKYYKDF